MQALELVGVFAIIGIGAFLLRGSLANLDHAPLWIRLAVGLAVGASISLVMFVRGGNVLPDELEPAALIALMAILVRMFFTALRSSR